MAASLSLCKVWSYSRFSGCIIYNISVICQFVFLNWQFTVLGRPPLSTFELGKLYPLKMLWNWGLSIFHQGGCFTCWSYMDHSAAHNPLFSMCDHLQPWCGTALLFNCKVNCWPSVIKFPCSMQYSHTTTAILLVRYQAEPKQAGVSVHCGRSWWAGVFWRGAP